MRTFSSLSSLLAVLAAAAGAVTPNATPRFETLFFGTLDIGTIESANATFGMRLNIPVNGGNLTDTSGKPVATVLPTADTGLISNSGTFFPEAVIPVRWAVDQKFGYFRLRGVGVPFQSDVAYIHAETDSDTWSFLNSRFLVANVTFPGGEGSNPIFTLYGLI